MIRLWCSFGTYSVLILIWGLGPNLVLDTDYIDIAEPAEHATRPAQCG